ncbi:MAG: hypothetical protein OEZ47_08325 [Gammaproteobacteria bacterium]|nr:hypothetical protein [Gammaproteobacteria bacterium]
MERNWNLLHICFASNRTVFGSVLFIVVFLLSLFLFFFTNSSRSPSPVQASSSIQPLSESRLQEISSRTDSAPIKSISIDKLQIDNAQKTLDQNKKNIEKFSSPKVVETKENASESKYSVSIPPIPGYVQITSNLPKGYTGLDAKSFNTWKAKPIPKRKLAEERRKKAKGEDVFVRVVNIRPLFKGQEGYISPELKGRKIIGLELPEGKK